MESEDLRRRVDYSYEKYGWTEQQKTFEKFMEERYANYKKPENTLRSYLDLLNQIVLKVKKPFLTKTMQLFQKLDINFTVDTVLFRDSITELENISSLLEEYGTKEWHIGNLGEAIST